MLTKTIASRLNNWLRKECWKLFVICQFFTPVKPIEMYIVTTNSELCARVSVPLCRMILFDMIGMSINVTSSPISNHKIDFRLLLTLHQR